jgi:hypothetical protein
MSIVKSKFEAACDHWSLANDRDDFLSKFDQPVSDIQVGLSVKDTCIMEVYGHQQQ